MAFDTCFISFFFCSPILIIIIFEQDGGMCVCSFVVHYRLFSILLLNALGFRLSFHAWKFFILNIIVILFVLQ